MNVLQYPAVWIFSLNKDFFNVTWFQTTGQKLLTTEEHILIIGNPRIQGQKIINFRIWPYV